MLLGMIPFRNHKRRFKTKPCWAISIITTGNEERIPAMIKAGFYLIALLVNLLQTAEFDIKKRLHGQYQMLLLVVVIKPSPKAAPYVGEQIQVSQEVEMVGESDSS